ncbi:Nn.00g094060.m01.CDS01 [Neocucurbitaria sp. VM-36]
MSATPQKRRYASPSEDSGHEQQESAMARHTVEPPERQAVSEPARRYGVYMHATANSATSKEPRLITVAMDWTTAYDAMRTHASDQIDREPGWGATRETITNGVYEIIDSSKTVRLRYDIDTIFTTSTNEEPGKIWKREKDWLAENHANTPPVHYGMYVARNCDDESKTERFFVGGFANLGEANHAMKTAAQAYLEAHSGTKLMERSVELVGEKGEVKQRYVIEKGRWQDGNFVKEDDWLNKDMDARGSNGPLSSSHKPAAAPIATPTPVPTKSGLRLRLPALGLPVPQAAPQPQPSTPAPPPTPAQQPGALTSDDTPWCTCRQPYDGDLMIECEDDECPIQWFHGRCVGIRGGIGEQETWYCEQCLPAQELKKKTRGSKRKTRGSKRKPQVPQGKVWGPRGKKGPWKARRVV